MSGRLYWDFYLTHTAQATLGPVVTVTMPFAFVNGLAINPPYGPHVEPSTYDFHGSMDVITFIGGGTRNIATGDIVTFFWLVMGAGGRGAYRYLTCSVPAPGEG
jgi:hypothetical protein